MQKFKNALISIGSVIVLIITVSIAGQIGRSCSHKALGSKAGYAAQKAHAKANIDETMHKIADDIHKNFAPFPKKISDDTLLLGCYYKPERDTLQYKYELHYKKADFTEDAVKTMHSEQRKYLLKNVAPQMPKIFSIGANVEWVYFVQDSETPLFIVNISPAEVSL